MLSLRFHKSARGLRQAAGLRSPTARFLSVEQDLSMFPEYLNAKSDMENGHFKRALPGLLRVQSVTSSAMGPAAPATVHVSLHVARAMRYLGQLDRAIEEVQRLTSPSAAAAMRNEDLVKALQASSLLHLFSGSAGSALQEASRALAVCEGDTAVPTSLFSPTHGLLGLSHYHKGGFSEAATHLQLAARWAETPLAQMVALNNFGYLVWKCGVEGEAGSVGQGPKSVRQDERLQRIQSKSLWHKDSFDEPGSERKQAVALKQESSSIDLDLGAREAIQYWSDAVAEAARGEGAAAAASGSSSAAGCAPPSSSAPLGPGMKAQAVPTAGTSQSPSPAPASDSAYGLGVNPALLSGLQDPSFAAAYACLLCNLSCALAAQGQGAQASDQLAAALQALDAHKLSMPCQPALGRVLSAVAYANMAASKAVTAEGLFRSALDKLEGPYANADPRFRYEHMAALGGYSLLLSKWEKRERDGTAMLGRAVAVFETLPRYRYSRGGDEGVGVGEGDGDSIYDAALLPLSAGLLYPGSVGGFA